MNWLLLSSWNPALTCCTCSLSEQEKIRLPQSRCPTSGHNLGIVELNPTHNDLQRGGTWSTNIHPHSGCITERVWSTWWRPVATRTLVIRHLLYCSFRKNYLLLSISYTCCSCMIKITLLSQWIMPRPEGMHRCDMTCILRSDSSVLPVLPLKPSRHQTFVIIHEREV